MTPHAKPKRGALAWVGFAAILLGWACGSGGVIGEAPEATVAESRAAQAAFRRLHAQWVSIPLSRRSQLRPKVDQFLNEHPDDPKARLVRLYRAWIDMETGKLGRASKVVSAEQPAGAVGDLAQVLRGAILTRQRQPKRALGLLEPLRGRIVDVDDRALFSAELVRAALAARRYDRAISYMLDWAFEAPEMDRENVKENIIAYLRRVPTPALERALAAMNDPSAAEADRAARRWLGRSIQRQLVKAALAEDDVALAGRLLDTIPSSLRTDDSRDALRRLAAEAQVAPRIAGRAVGHLLELSPRVARRRSAEVARGIARELAITSQGPGEQRVRLLSHQAEQEADVGRALAGLAGQGAAILIAGVTSASATAAREFAGQAEIPVLLLTAPRDGVDARGFAFVLGEQADVDADLLSRTMTERGYAPLVTVGPGGDVSCEASAPANGSRYSVGSWRRDGVRGVLLLGDPTCSLDVIADMRDHDLGAAVGLGLESASVGFGIAQRPLFVAASGRYPPRMGGSEGAASSWYATLGIDAVRLARAALAEFPEERIRDDAKVRRLHRRARDRLASAEVSLESTTRHGFGAGREIGRRLSVVERGAEGP